MPDVSQNLLTWEIRHRIRTARLNLSLTQESLASHLGVSRSTVKNWEMGRIRYCRLHNWHRLMAFLNGSLQREYFIGEQLDHLRHYLREHAPQPLKQSFATALKIAEQHAGGMEALLTALDLFLQKINRREWDNFPE